MRSKLILVGLLVIFLVPGVNAQWWDNDYNSRSIINITNLNESLPLVSNFTINVTFNHKQIVDLGYALANGSDFRIVVDHGREIDRVLCKGSHWNTESTCIEFPILSQIAASGNNQSYFAYFNNPAPAEPLENATNVYLIYDDWENNISKANWSNATQGGCTISIQDEKVVVNAGQSNEDCRMMAPLPTNKTAYKVVGGTEVDWLTNGHTLLTFALASEASAGWDAMTNFSGIRKQVAVEGLEFIDRLEGGGVGATAQITGYDNSTFNITGYSITGRRYLRANTTSTTGVGPVNGQMQYFYLFTSFDSGAGNYVGYFNFSDVRVMDHMEPYPEVTFGGVQFSNIDDCSTFNTSVLNFSIFNEENRTVPVRSDMDVTFVVKDELDIISNTSFSLSNRTYFLFCSDTNTSITVNATIKYNSTSGTLFNSSTRYYFLQNYNVDNVTDQITLFLLKDDLSNQIQFIVEDIFSNSVPDVIVKATRFFIGEGGYRFVDMGLTDFDGTTPMQLKLNEFYIFIIERNGIPIRSFPQKNLVNTNDIQLVTSSGNQNEWFEYYQSVGFSCVNNNATQNLVCTYSDGSNTLQSITLTLEHRPFVGGYESICSDRSTSAAGTVNCTYIGYNNTELRYSLVATMLSPDTGRYTNVVIDTGIISLVTLTTYNIAGIVIVFFLTLVGIMLSFKHPAIPMVTGVFVLGIGIQLNLLVVSSAAFVSLILAAGILIYKMRN